MDTYLDPKAVLKDIFKGDVAIWDAAASLKFPNRLVRTHNGRTRETWSGPAIQEWALRLVSLAGRLPASVPDQPRDRVTRAALQEILGEDVAHELEVVAGMPKSQGGIGSIWWWSHDIQGRIDSIKRIAAVVKPVAKAA